MVADKLYSDAYLSNSDYALVGGVKNQEINGLEGEFLRLMDFNLFIYEEEYIAYHKNLLKFGSILGILPVIPSVPIAEADVEDHKERKAVIIKVRMSIPDAEPAPQPIMLERPPEIN